MFRMLKTPGVLLLSFCLVGVGEALHKQWIPNTNYENKTNWDKGSVPCGSDIVQFPAQRKVSVFVESAHAVQEMRLPVSGEFILNPGAGFYVESGQDVGCGEGVTAQFKDSESLQWFDPALWQAAATPDDLQRGNFLFSVHEESVPCQHDDVVFKAHSSFRVDTSSDQSSIHVRSVSVLGKKFDGRPEFSQYLNSRSGRLQFYGSSVVAVGSPECGDPSGCDCGNSANHKRICSTVTCPSLSCKMPLLPVGHCCDVCGTVVTIHYAASFNLHTYRQRINYLFLTQPQYKSIQLGMSKVFRSQRLMGVIPFGASPEIQMVIIDEEKGAQSEVLAQKILEDACSQGSHLGIIGAEFEASSGNSSDQTGVGAGTVVGAMFGVLIVIALITIMVVLVRKGVLQLPSSLPSLSSFNRSSDIGDLGGPIDRGFDNPIFDKPNMLPHIPGMYTTDTNHSISMTQTGVHFVNPCYDENETDFNT